MFFSAAAAAGSVLASLSSRQRPAVGIRDTARPTTRSRDRSMDLDVEQLYRRYGDMVLGRCRSLLRNEADAQEVCQEVFLKAHRYRDRFRGESSPTTWLFKVTTTTCLNRIRTRKRRREDFPEDEPVVPVEDSYLAQSDARDLVSRLLDLTDETTQACLVYHYLDGMTHDEAGEMLGLSGAAVRKRLGIFRKSIRNAPPAWLEEVDR